MNDEFMGELGPESAPPPVNARNAADRGVRGVGGAEDELPSSSLTNASLESLDSGVSSDTGARLLFLRGRDPGFDLRCTLGGGAGPRTGELFAELLADLFAGSQILSTSGLSVPSMA